jgi:hypothetical protein
MNARQDSGAVEGPTDLCLPPCINLHNQPSAESADTCSWVEGKLPQPVSFANETGNRPPLAYVCMQSQLEMEQPMERSTFTGYAGHPLGAETCQASDNSLTLCVTEHVSDTNLLWLMSI